MNFSGISNRSALGQVLRAPLRVIPPTMQIPILQGRLKGKKWIVGSSQHGCWLGSYEYDKQQLFEATVKSGNVVFDLGAHVGFYTLLASVLVGETGRVFAFEPLPNNLNYLKQHLSLNSITNVQVIEAAVSDRTGVATFDIHDSSFQGHLSTTGQLQVKTVSLDDWIAKGKIPSPDYMKIDVEGAEMDVLVGARELLQRSHPKIALATHSDELRYDCCQFLKTLGYQLQPINAHSIEETDELFAFYQEAE